MVNTSLFYFDKGGCRFTEGGSEGEGAGELGVGVGDYRDGVGAGEGADFHCGELLINDVIPDLIGSVVAHGHRKEFNVRGDVEGQLAILILCIYIIS